MEPIVSSETSATKSQTPGNYPKRNKLQGRSACGMVTLGATILSLPVTDFEEPKDLREN